MFKYLTEFIYFCSCKGEKLQFVFRNINPSDRDSAYIVTMGIKEDGSYQSKSQITDVRKLCKANSNVFCVMLTTFFISLILTNVIKHEQTMNYFCQKILSLLPHIACSIVRHSCLKLLKHAWMWPTLHWLTFSAFPRTVKWPCGIFLVYMHTVCRPGATHCSSKCLVINCWKWKLMFKLKQFRDEQHWEIIHTVLTNKTVSDLFINISVFS